MQGATRIHGDLQRTPTRAAHVRWVSWLGSFAAATAAATALGAAAGAGDKVIPPEPSLPALKSIRLEPSSLLLEDARDARRVLVLGERTDGGWVDLTGVARWKVSGDGVAVDGRGVFTARKPGDGKATVSAAGLKADLAVKVTGVEARPVGFVRDVEPILSRAGCNAGPCHGSAKGKNGFKLSLRGYDPEYDYQALINDLGGRRLNKARVDESLMLQKPLGDVPHEGRQAIKPGSLAHRVLRQWIAEGAKPQAASARATNLTVLPDTVEMDLPGRRQEFLILAHYPDGTTRDVTDDAVLSSNNEEVALVKDSTLTALRRGEMAVLVRYEGLYASREVRVMGDRTGFQFAAMPEYNEVDRHVNAKLARMRTLPSDACTDAEFIRRASLDLTGLPPSVERVRKFLAEEGDSRAKRERLVDELLASPAFAPNWANKFADLLQCNSENLGKKGVWVFRNWIEGQLASRRPYDAFVRDLLLAKGSTFENPAGNYLRALRDPGKMTEDVSQTFLGVRFNCNKCHDHPFERWTQNQYYEFGAFFAQVAFKRGTLGRDVLIRGNETYASEQVSEEIVYRSYDGGEVRHPKNDAVMPAKVPYGHARTAKAEEDPRQAFAEWLTSPENPYFARSTVNRFWSYFLGRGIIDPVDDIRAGNPPSNPELLAWLEKGFVKSGYDLRWLMRTICTSRTYQLSIVPNRWNEDDTSNFSHALPRRLSAEQLMDAVAVATGHRPRFKDMPEGARAVEAPDGMVGGADFLALFGRPKRQSACECERAGNVTLAHALNLVNGPMLGECVTAPGNGVARIAESEPDDRKVIEHIYLACLCRMPTDKEVASVQLGKGAERLTGVQDLAWALLNSPAFLFNR